MCLWLICLFEDFLLLFLFLNFFHCVWTMSQCQWWWDFLCLKHPHQWIQTFHLFCTKESYIFYFTHPFLQKHPHQFIYFTHLFNKIFILLQFFIILSFTAPLSHKPNTLLQTQHAKESSSCFHQRASSVVFVGVQFWWFGDRNGFASWIGLLMLLLALKM